MRMTLLSMVLVAGVSSAALADEKLEAKQVLAQATEALRAVRAVQYEVRTEADGMLQFRVPQLTGTVTMAAGPNDTTPKVRMNLQATMPKQPKQPQQPEAIAVQMSCDGKTVFLAESGQKVYFTRELPAGQAMLNRAASVILLEFTDPRPLEREAKAVSTEYVGIEKVGDVDCDIVHAILETDGGEVRWYFGRTDHLPRRVQRFSQTPMGLASVTTTLSSLNTSPTIDDKLFHLERPAGYVDPPKPPSRSGSDFLAIGSQAPPWKLKTPAGEEVTLQGLRGKIVLLDFWATWCGPCIRAMPGVQKLYDKFKDRPVAIFGVNCYERDPNAKPAQFFKKKGFTYPLLLGGSSVAGAYKAAGIPTFYLIGPDGKVLLARSGFSPAQDREIEATIEKTLKNMAAAPPTTQGQP